MFKTFGLTHIALCVKNAEVSSRFYQEVFGVQEMYHKDGFIQVQTPDSRDIVVFEEKQKQLPKPAAYNISDFAYKTPLILKM